MRLGNFVIDIDEEDGENLKRLYTDAAYLRTVGGVGAYREFAAGKAMMGAGEGMAKGGSGGGGEGGGMMAGASLGVGLGMAQMMVRDQAGGSSLVPAVAGIICGACSATVAAGKFCSACGESLEKKAKEAPSGARETSFCTSCGSPLAVDASFCGQCGQKRGR